MEELMAKLHNAQSGFARERLKLDLEIARRQYESLSHSRAEAEMGGLMEPLPVCRAYHKMRDGRDKLNGYFAERFSVRLAVRARFWRGFGPFRFAAAAGESDLCQQLPAYVATQRQKAVELAVQLLSATAHAGLGQLF